MTEPTPPDAPSPDPVDPATSSAAARAAARSCAARSARAPPAPLAGVRGGYACRGHAAPRRPASAAPGRRPTGLLPPVPFHGVHQAGILPQPQRQTAVIAFDVTADGRGELDRPVPDHHRRARFLTAGGTPPPVGIGGPPSDSGVLGPTVVPDGLTVTVGVGSIAVR